MAITIHDADAYILTQCLDVEDWESSDEQRKTRLLNVSNRVLTNHYSKYVIPDNAVYEFANVLSVKFNDTNKMAQNGVIGFTVSGMNFQFSTPEKELRKMVTQTVLDLISEGNEGVTLRLNRIGRVVR